VPTVHVEAFLHLVAGLGDAGADAIDLVADIHAIGDGALVAVFHDEVLAEEADGLLGRRGGEADEVGVEILQHLPPEAVDGAVALIGDDEVEGLDGDGGIVGHVLRAVVGAADLVAGEFVGVLGQLLAAQHGVKPLDGADGDAADVVELVRGEVLDVVNGGELPAVIGQHVLIKLGLRLPAEIRPVHEEEDALGLGELDEAVGKGAGGEGLAGASSHLDERARVVRGEGLLQAGIGLDLAISHTEGVQRMREGHLGKQGAEGLR
jgi:hypothetical protein